MPRIKASDYFFWIAILAISTAIALSVKTSALNANVLAGAQLSALAIKALSARCAATAERTVTNDDRIICEWVDRWN